jgi:hypothetical protein
MAIAVCAFGFAGSSAASLAQWERANQTAIAKIASPSARAAAKRSFDATLARIAAKPALSASAASARAMAQSELAFPGRYDLRDSAAKAPTPSPFDRFMQWLGDRWNAFWSGLFGHATLATGAAEAVGYLILLAIAIGLVLLAVRFFSDLQIERAGRGTAFTPLENQRNAHALYLQACSLAQNASYEEAVQRLFLAAITALDLRGVLRDNPSATVGDMRRILRSRNAALIPSFDGVAAPFVDATYAETAIADAAWMQAKDAYARLTATDTP